MLWHIKGRQGGRLVGNVPDRTGPLVGKRLRSSTISDVAALANVSVGTASKALNGHGQLRTETRERVLTAADKLGFRPNALARGLLSGRTFTVGLITNDSFGRFSIPVLLGAEDALDAGQISVFLCDGRNEARRERHYVQTLLARQVDGIIVTGRRTDPRPPIASNLPVPVVYAMTQSTDPDDISVVVDEAEGARLATEHLLARGRRQIGHITGPPHHRSARVRADSASRVIAEAGGTIRGVEVLFGEWSESWGRQAVHTLLHRAPSTDAIFCGSDQIARGAVDALRDAGRQVPEDIAVVGYDNWDVMATACRPPLTTVDMNLEELGRSAAARLLAAIDGDSFPGIYSFPCRLVERESTEAVVELSHVDRSTTEDI